jgi:hypothetical protein
VRRYSATVLIETDGDPAAVIRSLSEGHAMLTGLGARYEGPDARIAFSPLMTEAEAH